LSKMLKILSIDQIQTYLDKKYWCKDIILPFYISIHSKLIFQQNTLYN